ncbi:cob(I)yrinic acid a,c-diamide adenosyltransferase [Limosilactobacillus sp. STM2_1]|uniref:Corrinoid adenosyltransferase n=1 Tax=Limosilactobacillus rudii TaxID=2759755 RepID=A0A7W3UL17_9LACO|nr:cob(I)yrinic acid a,c-diamide adenosyltransferase [Limosilactobacillus rudii]MBB1079447.1 cob(I)yrinic acid a,c-diamide adenosyltransferase [Limosilactobacillus rudii]MBB1097493.1 cob(I)yrinic acid a,c-diamide adenosyltransferase [Limosilactobacillus rudii]MCD7134603.1 cob(I)yrinic acid a,c-diamide adenosyltransferase [Limosilactobacillus rudii]
MKLYTGVGDKGMTKLIGGTYVSKDSDRVKTYGTIDELNTYIGLVIAKLSDNDKFKDLKRDLLHIQNCLFDLGTDIANPQIDNDNLRFNKENIKWLETRIDNFQNEPPAIKRFILPGGSELSALLQICRTTTRKAERYLVTLSWECTIPNDIEVFINRLSDYFYAIARVANYRLNVEENFYKNGNEVFH